MGESGDASRDSGLVSAIRGMLEQFGVKDALALAEAVATTAA